jgi:uncharacterized membrane protein
MEVKMKKLFLMSAIVASSVLAVANATDFPAHKVKVIENSDKRIAVINEFKECAHAAVDQNAMMACRKIELEKNKALKSDMKLNSCKMKHNSVDKVKNDGVSKGCKSCPSAESNSTTK